jgi:hypothetical protein
MEDNIFFSCGNIVVIPSKLLSEYPRLNWMADYFNVKSGAVVLVTDTQINRHILDSVNIIAYAVLIFKKKTVEIITLNTTNVVQSSDVFLEVLTYLLNFIQHTFYKSVAVNVDISDTNQINFYVANNFMPMPQKNTKTKLYLMYTSDHYHKNPTINDIMLTTGVNSQLVKFPARLAKILSSFVQLNYEVGGNVCVDYVEQKNKEDVLVLGLRQDKVVKGEAGSVNFEYKDFSPFSFHTHPDITLLIDSNQRYISWPSGIDIKSILSAFLNKINVLSHFVITTEGIWVIYVSVAFQKFLSNLAVFYKNDLIDIINNIGDIYQKVEKYRMSNFIDPMYRKDIRDDFINKSNTITIKDLQSVQEKHYLGDNFFLFKLRLLTWNKLKKDIVLKFPYFIDADAGLPEKISSTCSIKSVDVFNASI